MDDLDAMFVLASTVVAVVSFLAFFLLFR